MAPPKKEQRFCKCGCGSILLYYQKYYATKACYGKASRGDGFVDRARKSDIKFRPVHRVTDREQMKINLSIDRSDNLQMECRILSPGHPDFEAVAKTITPLHRIKRTERIIGVLDGIDGGYV